MTEKMDRIDATADNIRDAIRLRLEPNAPLT